MRWRRGCGSESASCSTARTPSRTTSCPRCADTGHTGAQHCPVIGLSFLTRWPMCVVWSQALSRIEGAYQASSSAASSSRPIVLSTKDQARELMLRVTPTVASMKLGANEKKAWSVPPSLTPHCLPQYPPAHGRSIIMYLRCIHALCGGAGRPSSAVCRW